MAIPSRDVLINAGFQALKELGGEALNKDFDKKVAADLNLSNEDINEMYEPSRTKLSYELAWCRTYLRKAGLIDRAGWGKWAITSKGLNTSIAIGAQIINSFDSQNKLEIEKEIDNDLEESIPVEQGNFEVEKEEVNKDDVEILEPFDPTQIDIKDRRMMLKALFERLNFDEIDLFTDFQRQGDLWDKTKQSRLIESILIRFPLPAFYFDGSNDNKWLIVDGLQRISALKNFVIDRQYKGLPFKLFNLEFLKVVEGCTYDELPREFKRRIDETEITVYIISPGTPEKVKYNLFKRINTSGLILEPQEIRHALNQGIPASFIRELSCLEEFKIATNYSIRTDRMLDRDFVTRYVSFYLMHYSSYEPDLDSFLNKGMSLIKELTDQNRAMIKSNFIKAMTTCAFLFDRYAFRKRYRFDDARKPINKALFEIWSVSLAKTSNETIERLKSNPHAVNEKFIELLNDDKYFESSITSATGDKRKVAKRFSEIENLINSF